MANEQGNTTDDRDEGSPFTRPTFIGAGVLVLVIVLLGVVLAVRVARTDDTTTTPPPSLTAPQTPSESTSSPPTDPGASVCGLAGTTDSGPLTSAPAATWDYEGTTAYPKSPEVGPGKTAPEGYRFCFQHSAAGAVFATANALALPEAERVRRSWIEYFVSAGPNRDKLLDTFQSEPSSAPTGIRLRIVGFKVLSYEGSTSRVDIAVEASGNAQTVTGSYVYELTWQAGDWKLNSDVPTPFNFSTVSSTAGYIPWSG